MPAYVNDLFPLSAESSMYLSFHQSLIADRRRLLTFCKAIKQVVQPGDVVMDIGVGTGVLSLAAIQAGASKVIGVDEDDIIIHARETFKSNGCTRRTRLLRGNILDLRFTGDEPDVIVAELLGSFALAENITEIACHLRTQFPSIKRMVPQWFELLVAPAEDKALNGGIRVFEEPVDGLDLTHLSFPALNNVYVKNLSAKHHLGPPETLAHVDLMKIKDGDLRASKTCKIARKGTLHGFTGWFRSGLSEDVVMETGPFHPRVHWEDVFFPVEYPVEVREGDQATFQLVALCHGSGDIWSWNVSVKRRGKEIYKCKLNSEFRLPHGRVNRKKTIRLP